MKRYTYFDLDHLWSSIHTGTGPNYDLAYQPIHCSIPQFKPTAIFFPGFKQGTFEKYLLFIRESNGRSKKLPRLRLGIDFERKP